MHLYHRVWSAVGVRRLLVANFLSAAAIGAMPVSIILGLQARYGGLATAGSSAGLFGLGNALGLIIQGRLLDRGGQRRIVAAAAAACIGTLLALLAMINNNATQPPRLVIAAGFLLAGVSLPGLTAAVRSRLGRHAGLAEVRLPAYAMLSVTFQAGMAVGPLLVSAALILLPTTTGLLVPIVELVAAAGCFISVGGIDNDQPATVQVPAPEAERRRSVGGLLILACIALVTGAASGMTSVGIPAVAIATGHPGLSGVQFAALAIGDLAGGLIYGGRRVGAPLGRQLLLSQGAAVVCALGVVGVSHRPISLTVVLIAGALCGSPAGILFSALLDRVSSPARIAAGYTVIVASGLIGSALASSAAGQLADRIGPSAPFVMAPVALLAALIISAVWLARHRAPA